MVQTDNRDADLGDGHLLEIRSGLIFYSYRYNLVHGTSTQPPCFRIKVALSRDNGLTWTDHSTVKEVHPAEGEVRGLWSSFLHQSRDGKLHCLYDDEDEAWVAGCRRHQWLMMKTWDDQAGAWGSPVIVSRCREPRQLSRDGMPSVVELADGSLLCALESVATAPPYQNVIRQVRSDDAGRMWNWSTEDRPVLYCPSKQGFSAVSPWLSRLADGRLICVFATDEDRESPDAPGATVKAMHREIKYVVSADQGRTWSRLAAPVYVESHRAYMPQILSLNHSRNKGLLLCLFLDTTRGFLGIRGTVSGSFNP